MPAFKVCAVEFEEAFTGGVAAQKKQLAEKHANFSALVWPKDFIKDRRSFDAAFLIYVLQTMPLDKERRSVLKHVRKKLSGDGYMLYASRYGQITDEMKTRRVRDGYFMWPRRQRHSFYTDYAVRCHPRLTGTFVDRLTAGPPVSLWLLVLSWAAFVIAIVSYAAISTSGAGPSNDPADVASSARR